MLRMHWSQSTPVHVPNTNKDIAPAYIEVDSGSFQVSDRSGFDSARMAFLGRALIEHLWQLAG